MFSVTGIFLLFSLQNNVLNSVQGPQVHGTHPVRGKPEATGLTGDVIIPSSSGTGSPIHQYDLPTLLLFCLPYPPTHTTKPVPQAKVLPNMHFTCWGTVVQGDNFSKK